MSDKPFRFKQFSVFHDKCTLKVNTDAVLLGAYADVEKSKRILDIGTGSGVIALMLAQRSGAIIDAVEIDPDSAKQAGANFLNSPWNSRLKVYCASFRDFFSSCHIKYHIIVSNPPFFCNSLKSPFPDKSLAKHNNNLTFEELLAGAIKLLHEDGYFYVILPFIETRIFREKAKAEGLFLIRELLIHPKQDKPVNRVISCFGLIRKEVCTGQINLRTGNGLYSEEYKKLSCDYFLDF